MDKVYFIYGLGTCSLNKELKYECKKIKKGDNVVLERLWFATEDEQKAKDMIRLNVTDLNDGGIYPYLGLQEVCLNDIIPKQSPMLIYLYDKVKNGYIEVGYINNLVEDESEIGFIPNFADLDLNILKDKWPRD